MTTEIINSVKNLVPNRRDNYSASESHHPPYSCKPKKQKSETATLKKEGSQYILMLLSVQKGREISENVLGVNAINILLQNTKWKNVLWS